MIRQLAKSYAPEVAATLREIADELEAEAEREERAALPAQVQAPG